MNQEGMKVKQVASKSWHTYITCKCIAHTQVMLREKCQGCLGSHLKVKWGDRRVQAQPQTRLPAQGVPPRPPPSLHKYDQRQSKKCSLTFLCVWGGTTKFLKNRLNLKIFIGNYTNLVGSWPPLLHWGQWRTSKHDAYDMNCLCMNKMEKTLCIAWT